MTVKGAYNQAGASGLYQKTSGLRGKYDHVRRLWEDEIIRMNTWPYLKKLARHRGQINGLRVLDLGCGCGDGYELLFGPVKAFPGGHFRRILSSDMLREYIGVDVNRELLEQGRSILGREERVSLVEGDFLCNFPVNNEPPFDLYMANYGTLSHCLDRELVELLADIARHARDGSLIIGDWLGCYACEWQDYWLSEAAQPVNDYTIPYVISYLYDEEERCRQPLEAFPLRLMHPRVVQRLIGEAARRTGVKLKICNMFDRSMMVGRHIETGEYCSEPRPLRTQINSLLEPGRSTDLRQLEACYQPKPGFSGLNQWFATLTASWNSLVRLSTALLNGESVDDEWKNVDDEWKKFDAEWKKDNDECKKDNDECKKDNTGKYFCHSHLPVIAAEKGLVLYRLVERAKDLKLENMQANIIEPQLAYALRDLENSLQHGDGMGHGLSVIVEVVKK